MSHARPTVHARRRHAAAAASIAAGVVHVAAAGPHLSQGWLLAGGFLAMGMLQVALGIGLALRGDRRLLVLGAIGVHVVALSAWALSRTVGLPAFLHPGVEPIGAADAIAASMGLAAVVLLAWRASRPAPTGRSRAASLTVLTFTWALAITGTAAGLGDIADTPDHHHAGDHGEAGHHEGAAGHHDAVSHDTGSHTATSPRPQPDPPSEVAHSDPRTDLVEEPEPVSTSSESSEDHTHAPGQEH